MTPVGAVGTKDNIGAKGQKDGVGKTSTARRAVKHTAEAIWIRSTNTIWARGRMHAALEMPDIRQYLTACHELFKFLLALQGASTYARSQRCFRWDWWCECASSARPGSRRRRATRRGPWPGRPPLCRPWGASDGGGPAAQQRGRVSAGCRPDRRRRCAGISRRAPPTPPGRIRAWLLRRSATRIASSPVSMTRAVGIGHVFDENPDLVDLGLGVLDRRKAIIEVFRKGPCGHLVLPGWNVTRCRPDSHTGGRRAGRRQVVRQAPGRRYVLPTAQRPAPAPDAGRHQPVMVAIGEISLSTST